MEEKTPSTSEIPTTTGTGTSQADGSATATNQNDGGLAAALGDGTGGTKDATTGDGTGDTPPKAPDKPTAPDTYTPWTVPEGYELDAKLVEQATPVFKELGLSQEQSQKLVDLYAKATTEANKAVMDSLAETRKEWREGMLKDPALGKLVGKDGNFGPDSPLVQTVNRALTGLQNPKLVSDFKAAMDLTGAGDNPAFVRVLHALASKVTEGTSYAQGQPTKTGTSRPSAGAALYPNLPTQSG
jgi:hypothetical protein